MAGTGSAASSERQASHHGRCRPTFAFPFPLLRLTFTVCDHKSQSYSPSLWLMNSTDRKRNLDTEHKQRNVKQCKDQPIFKLLHRTDTIGKDRGALTTLTNAVPDFCSTTGQPQHTMPFPISCLNKFAYLHSGTLVGHLWEVHGEQHV